MKSFTKILLLTGILGLIALMTGCQSDNASADATSAVTCDKCKTVWVKRPAGPLGRSGSFYQLKDTAVMECDECKSAVATFFSTGSFKHSCSKCGGTMTHCTSH